MNKKLDRPLRCAIYTRKSTEHGLELEFNFEVQIQRWIGREDHGFGSQGAMLRTLRQHGKVDETVSLLPHEMISQYVNRVVMDAKRGASASLKASRRNPWPSIQMSMLAT
jgi:hypothetical protein